MPRAPKNAKDRRAGQFEIAAALTAHHGPQALAASGLDPVEAIGSE